MAHAHGHHHSNLHRMGHLAARALGRRDVYRVGRRQFVADMGRRTFAVAILGAGAAACSGSDDSAGESTTAAGADESSSNTDPDAATPSDPPTTTSPDSDESTASDAPGTETEADPMLDWAQVRVGNVSAYVLVRGREAAVVDTGNPGSEDEIGQALVTLGVDYGAVGHVVLTHHHPDHVGSLSGVLGEAPTALTYAGEADIANITSPNPLQAVGDGDEVFGLEVISTPGHTPGSISVLDRGIGLLIAGDALNGNEAGTEISGANPSFSTDMATADQSVAKLAARPFETAAFGHGNPVESGAGDLVAVLAASL